MRILMFILVLLAAASASAQRVDACTGASIPAGVRLSYDFDLTKEYEGCLDMRPGSAGFNAHGMVEWQYCRNPETRQYYIQRQVTTRADLGNLEMVREAFAAGWPNISAADRFRLAKKYAHMVKPMGHPENAAVWCEFRNVMIAGIPPVVAPTGWVVAKNAGYPTRPTYLVLRGDRMKISNGRTPVGTACEMTGAIVEGSTTYGYPDGAPKDSVAVCVRK